MGATPGSSRVAVVAALAATALNFNSLLNIGSSSSVRLLAHAAAPPPHGGVASVRKKRLQPDWTPPLSWGGPTPPSWGQTWAIANSTAVYACNYQGPLNLDVMGKFRLLQLDWSNEKAVWSNAHPMDSQDLLAQQAAAIKALRPDAIVGVYRNTVKALPWFSSVRERLANVSTASLFLPYRKNSSSGEKGTGFVSPPCDSNWTPSRCSALYHDQNQTPQFNVTDDGINGTCFAPCDCGEGVPAGEYLYDHRNPDTRTFILNDISDVLSNPNITMLYLDDYWVDYSEPINPGGDQPAEGYCSHSPIGGPSEIQLNCTDDMGLVQADTTALTKAWQSTFAEIYNIMDAAGAYAYLGFTNVNTPGPSTIRSALTNLCQEGSSGSQYNAAALYLLTTQPECCPPDRNTTLLQFEEDLAFFQLVRGPWSFIGFGWEWCAVNYTLPDGLFVDYGDPVGTCSETSTGSGIFVRDFANSKAQFDTNTYTGSITML
jgi:hypothetical protein